jgi:hypothetical protein
MSNDLRRRIVESCRHGAAAHRDVALWATREARSLATSPRGESGAKGSEGTACDRVRRTLRSGSSPDRGTMGIVQRETGLGLAHHHAPVRDPGADTDGMDSTASNLHHWKCLDVACTARWALPPGEKPLG